MTELSKEYGVFGDYGYATETLLYETNSVNEAIRWAEEYTRNDMGGYTVVEVGFFLRDGTYDTSWVKVDDERYLYDEA